MRLLLDEHIDTRVAHVLRERGHDIVSAAEEKSLHKQADSTLLEWARSERRVLVTRDYRTIRPLVSQRLRDLEPVWGVLFVSRRFPDRRESSGKLIEALEAYLRAHPADDALRDREEWL